MNEQDLGVGAADVAQAGLTLELTIKGDIQVLRLEPGDTILVTLREPVTMSRVEHVREILLERFPDNPVLIFSNNIELSIQRAAL